MRVVFGYDGYADELGLRTAFIDAVEAVEGGAAGPALLPNLIICRKNALLKLTGHPFIAPIRENGEWDMFGSTREAPFGLLLELLWARLANQFHAQFPVDDSLEIEAVAPLLTGKPVKISQQRGWHFYEKTLSKAQLAEVAVDTWMPFELSLEETVLIQMAMSRGDLDLENKTLLAAAAEGKVELKTFADRLVAARLFAWRSDGVAHPIGETLHQVIAPDGRFWISPNSDLLTRWIAENRPEAQAKPLRNSEAGQAAAVTGTASAPKPA